MQLLGGGYGHDLDIAGVLGLVFVVIELGAPERRDGHGNSARLHPCIDLFTLDRGPIARDHPCRIEVAHGLHRAQHRRLINAELEVAGDEVAVVGARHVDHIRVVVAFNQEAKYLGSVGPGESQLLCRFNHVLEGLRDGYPALFEDRLVVMETGRGMAVRNGILLTTKLHGIDQARKEVSRIFQRV